MTQRVFITGGASGLGRAIALRYAKEGAKVCIGDINPEQGVAVEAELNQAGGEGYFVECDVRRLSDFEKVRDDLVQKWGGVDVVVNNAGDANNDDELDIADAIYLVEFLYRNGSPPPAPFPGCKARPGRRHCPSGRGSCAVPCAGCSCPTPAPGPCRRAARSP